MCRPQFGRYFPLTLRYLRWPKARPCAAARSRQSPNGRSRPANVMGEGSSSPTSRVMSPPGRLHTSSRITDLLGAAGEQEKSRRLGHRVQVIIQLGSPSDGLSIASSTLEDYRSNPFVAFLGNFQFVQTGVGSNSRAADETNEQVAAISVIPLGIRSPVAGSRSLS
jgi:hypothetical protein